MGLKALSSAFPIPSSSRHINAVIAVIADIAGNWDSYRPQSTFQVSAVGWQDSSVSSVEPRRRHGLIASYDGVVGDDGDPSSRRNSGKLLFEFTDALRKFTF